MNISGITDFSVRQGCREDRPARPAAESPWKQGTQTVALGDLGAYRHGGGNSWNVWA